MSNIFNTDNISIISFPNNLNCIIDGKSYPVDYVINNVKKVCHIVQNDYGTISKKYYLNGLLHNEDGPAVFSYSRNGTLNCKEYYFCNMLHRENGPAIYHYDKHGDLYHVEYRFYNKLHRVGGPAISGHDIYTLTPYNRFYFHGEEHNENDIMTDNPRNEG